MATELRVPQVGESVSEVQIGDWSHQEGDLVKQDEALVAIETDKVTLEVTAPARGRLVRIILTKGMNAHVGDVVGLFEREADAAIPVDSSGSAGPASARQVPIAEATAVVPEARQEATASIPDLEATSEEPAPWASPAARRRLAERGFAGQARGEQGVAEPGTRGNVQRRQSEGSSHLATQSAAPIGEFEEVVKMSPLRQRVAERLLESQHSMALLTTFNEIDMAAVQQLRSESKNLFLEKHGVKLGLMSFFVRASLEALKSFPVVNAEVRGTDIIYKNHYDIGIAVGGGRGLVVPVLRNVERLGFAAIERKIAEFAARAKENKLELRDLTGGTFTITNGGVYGSMLSTPIVNPPQSAILGLHAINDRPVARNGQVVIRPMMYVALTYDHRIVDGREAVSFLRLVKDLVENPIRLLLEI